MSNTDRRGFLRGGLRAALGTGGLLLPWQGDGALALPDTDQAAKLRVVAASLPVSAECLEMRAIKREMTQSSEMQERLGIDGSQKWWRALYDRHELLAERLYSRPVKTWGQVAEFAEIAWFRTPKEEIKVGPPDRRFGAYTGQLARDPRQLFGGHWEYYSEAGLCAHVALIEGVLTLAGGERFDPRVERNHVRDVREWDGFA